MTKVHRNLLQGLNTKKVVNLNTTYGFQENVPQMTEKLTEYFDTSLHINLKTLDFTSFEDAPEVQRSLFKSQVREASYVFAGPGSPTYALAQWAPLNLQEDLYKVLAAGGTVCFASAAVLTLGAFTAPVYEIYKAGAKPYWLEGLDLMKLLGLHCVVVPHFDNREGSNYDTSCCYLGRRRLSLMERELPEGVATLGIDEHTALIIDFEERTLTVEGRSNAYWGLQEQQQILAKGTTTSFDALEGDFNFDDPPVDPAKQEESPSSATDLASRVETGGPSSIDALAELVKLAQQGGHGFIDPAPLIESILDARVAARTEGNYQLSDVLRDLLTKANINVSDTPNGTEWRIRS